MADLDLDRLVALASSTDKAEQGEALRAIPALVARIQAAEELATAAEAVKASGTCHVRGRYVLEVGTLPMEFFVNALAAYEQARKS